MLERRHMYTYLYTGHVYLFAAGSLRSQALNNVNALEIRNHLGRVLDQLEKTGEPILVSKGRHVRAVLISPEDYQRRFLDHQAEERRQELLERTRALRKPAIDGVSSLDVLRKLRGYTD